MKIKTSKLGRGAGPSKAIGKKWADQIKEARAKSLTRSTTYNKCESKK